MINTVASPYIGDISDIRLGDSSGFILSVSMDICFPAEIEEHPEPALYMSQLVTFEKPSEDDFISFDDVTIEMIKEWARVCGDLENKVIEHRERIKAMIESTTIVDEEIDQAETP